MPKLCLHLGPHKTATTHLQDALADLRPAMAAAGRFYLPLTPTRVNVTTSLEICRREQATWAGSLFRARKIEASVSRYLRTLPAEGRDVLLSDERLLGQTDESLAGQLYPSAGDRLQRLARLLPMGVSDIYLAVRDYAPQLTSLYGESLRWGTRVRPEELVAAYASPARHWTQLIDTILAAFPEARLHLWQFEDFSQVRTQVLSLMSGLPETVTAQVPDQIRRPGMSAAAINEILAVFPAARTFTDRQFAALAAEGRHPHDPTEPVFEPWPAAQRAAMSAEYAGEMAGWQANPRIRVLRPAGSVM